MGIETWPHSDGGTTRPQGVLWTGAALTPVPRPTTSMEELGAAGAEMTTWLTVRPPLPIPARRTLLTVALAGLVALGACTTPVVRQAQDLARAGQHEAAATLLQSAIAATPVLVGNTLIAVTHNGGIYGFQPQ